MRFSRYDEVSSLIPAVPWFLLSKYLFSAGPSEPSKRYMRESFKACASSNPVLLKLFFTALAVAALYCADFSFSLRFRFGRSTWDVAEISFNFRMSP